LRCRSRQLRTLRLPLQLKRLHRLLLLQEVHSLVQHLLLDLGSRDSLESRVSQDVRVTLVNQVRQVHLDRLAQASRRGSRRDFRDSSQHHPADRLAATQAPIVQESRKVGTC
jgi:hypothetical protein